MLVAFGADENILFEAHPHIGTNKLPGIIENIRDYIIQHDGEVHFDSKLTDIYVEKDVLTGIQINNSDEVEVSNLVLATGHSARDIYELLHEKNVRLELKSFAMGVRIEHPQEVISEGRIKNKIDRTLLPPAAYSWVEQVEGAGVFSFCMCPGGIVAPCATSQEEVVTNGWSPSKRNNPFANSGIVVQLDPAKMGWKNVLDGLQYQKDLEKKAWIAGGKNQFVPAQRLFDFLNGERSSSLVPSSYRPGITSEDLNQVLPDYIGDRLRQGFKQVGKKWKSYLSEEALLHAPESRTSSPVRIPRGEDLQHVDVQGLYPCAEGAGYAGGIVSAAIDGMRCVESIKLK